MPKKPIKLHKCPSCKKNTYVVSIFGSICSSCLYDDKQGKLTDIKDIKTCPACGKKFKQIDNYSYKPNCKHFPKGTILSIG